MTNEAQISVDETAMWMSGSWCVEEGQTVELSFQATVRALLGASDVEAIAQLTKTVGMEDPVVVAQASVG